MGSHFSRIEVLGRRLRSLIDEERSEAAQALGREDPQEVIELVRRVMREADYPPIRRDAVSAIAYTRSSAALDALLELSVDPEVEVAVRAQATEGLGYVIQFKSRGHPRFEEISDALIARLEDPEPQVRLWAAQALGVAYVKRGRRALIALALDDRSVVDDRCWGTVRDEARAALYALEHRKDLLWPLLERRGGEAVIALRKRVLSYLKMQSGPTTVPPPPEDDLPDDESVQAERELLEDVLLRQDRMPIYQDKHGCFSVTAEGLLFFTNNEGETRREQRPRWLIVAIKASCEEFPELEAMLPERPDDAHDCDTCKGKGKVLRPWRRVGPFCDGCWGLGWTCLPTVTKEDLEQAEAFADSDLDED